MTTAQSSTPVTRIARRYPLPGREADYEVLVRELFRAMHGYRGFLGADLLPPEEPGAEYQVVVKFASEADLEVWDASPVRAAILRRMEDVAENAPQYRRLSGLEAWFSPTGASPARHPSRLRMAIVTWLGIFPTVSFFLWFVAPLLQSLPFLLRVATLTALIVITMTWMVMPLLVRVLARWLNPRPK